MSIEDIARSLALQRTREQAAFRIQGMILNDAKAQGAAITRLLEEVAVITDPNLGNHINILA